MRILLLEDAEDVAEAIATSFTRRGDAVDHAVCVADATALAVANLLVGNPEGAAATEATLVGPRLRLERGVYIGVHGPEMETPAETRMYRQWGADAVGMSTVLEIIAARHMGMRVLGLSCLTNKNLPDCMSPAPLEEILAVAAATGKNLGRLIRAMVTKL